MSTKTSSRKVMTCTLPLAYPASQIFPLVCPVREYEWDVHWDCKTVHSDSGLAEDNCVFLTDFSGQEGRLWYVCRYEPDRCIEFISTYSSAIIIRLVIGLDEDKGVTNICFTHIYTALNAIGQKEIDALTEENYVQRGHLIVNALRHYLETGTMLREEVLMR